MREIFKNIKEFEGLYQISNSGKVKSLERIDNRGRHISEKILKDKIDKDGYHYVILSKEGVPFTKKNHRLVALAFIPNLENKRTVNHQDLDKDNNHDWNLEWATRYENNFHASKHGIGVAWRKGENTLVPNLKLKKLEKSEV